MAQAKLLEIETQATPPGGWQQSGALRIPPLDRRKAGLRRRVLAALFEKVGTAKAPNLFLTLMRNMRLFLPFFAFTAKLMPKGELDRADTELAILRTAWVTRSRYEWGQHVDIGLRAGLTPVEIGRVASGADATGWSARQAAILRAVDELVTGSMVQDDTWAALSDHFSDRLLIELLMTITSYAGLAAVLNTLGTQLENPVEEILANTPIPG